MAGNVWLSDPTSTTEPTAPGGAVIPGSFTINSSGATGPVVVNFELGGSAEYGADFTFGSTAQVTQPDPVNFPNRFSATIAKSPTPTPITIVPQFDGIAEGYDNLAVSLLPSTDYTISSSGIGMVIYDNTTTAPTTITVEASGNLSEDSVGTIQYFTFKRNITGTSLPVRYTYYGSATLGDDYSTTASTGYQALDGIVTFAANASEVKVRVNAINNAVADGTRRIWVQGLNGTGYSWNTALSSDFIAIADNDQPLLHIYDSSGFVEQNGFQYFRVGLFDVNGVATTSALDVKFKYSTDDGTATQGTGDYDQVTQLTSPEVTIKAGDKFTAIGVQVRVNEDQRPETNETYFVKLIQSTFVNAKYWDLEHSTAVGTITDEDTRITITPSVSSPEGGSNLVFTASLKFNTPTYVNQQTFTVDYVIGPPSDVGAHRAKRGGADPDLSIDDYQIQGMAATGKLHFVAGQNTATQQFILKPLNETAGNGVDEFDEQVQVTLSNPTIGAIFENDTAIGTIVDNDAQPTISLDYSYPTNTSVAENGGNVFFKATVTGRTAKPISYKYSTADGSALAGSDFEVANEVPQADPFVLSATSIYTYDRIYVSDNSAYERPEQFSVYISSAEHLTIVGAPLSIEITDNDPKPRLRISDATVTEGAPYARFTITKTGASEVNSTYFMQTVADSATAPGDYTSTSGYISAPASMTSWTTDVPITNDLTDEVTVFCFT